MARAEEINARISKLEAEKEIVISTERTNLLAKMKADIAL